MQMAKITMGGGILLFAFLTTNLSNINAIELNTICTSNTECKITTPYNEITNNNAYIAGGGEGIVILARIDTFINYDTITAATTGIPQQIFTFKDGGYVAHFINYGNMYATNKMGIWADKGDGINALTNYGVMGSINYGANSNTMSVPLTLNNLGLIGAEYHTIEAKNNSKILIQNYMVKISETASIFNNFTQNSENNFSHLVISTASKGNISFKDGNSKIILDFDDGFEFGKGYLINKIAIDSTGKTYSALGVDFSRLVPRSDIYLLSQSGQYFIAKLVPQHSTIGILHKSNIRTMNNFYVMSNSMIYPRKHSKSQNLGRRNSSLRMSEASMAIQDLNANEIFFYQNEAQTRRIKRPNKRNYSRNLNNSQNLNADSANRTKSQNQRFSQNLAQSNDYYFILTPFVNHNYFFESGRYNLSGFDYGFLTAFSGKITPNNSLGTHFMMSYGTLSDSSDKNFHISNLNLNLGVNYKLDLVWDMYLKARGDFFYFLNQVKTLTMMKVIKPNNLGFGVSVAYGKDFDFKQGGILGIEGGIDYKALSASEITLDSMSETYQKSLYHLLYLDLGISYAKYFGGFGFNAGLGIKGNVSANKLAKSKINLKNFNQSVDMILDNDKILGYANLALSYVLNAKNFDMEFSLAYYGNYGDRIISNGGGFEWRVMF